MSVKFCVLGSGSRGNAVLIMTPQLHVLIDAGFPPDELTARMEGTGASWASLHAIVLTHTHADHLSKKCLTLCAQHDIHFICHERHAEQLGGGRYFKHIREKNCLRTYSGSAGSFELRATGARIAAFDSFQRDAPPAVKADDADIVRFHPIPVPHDAPPTFGFRIEARIAATAPKVCPAPDVLTVAGIAAEQPAPYAASASGPPVNAIADNWIKLGYLVDLGACAEEIAREVVGVDLLALEFNHDEHLERTSGRHRRLIERVLGDDGHLSNRQAADVFRRVLEQCPKGGPELLVQMHLSQDCNRAELAYQAAQEVLLTTGARTRVFSSRQNERGTVHSVGGA